MNEWINEPTTTTTTIGLNHQNKNTGECGIVMNDTIDGCLIVDDLDIFICLHFLFAAILEESTFEVRPSLSISIVKHLSLI